MIDLNKKEIKNIKHQKARESGAQKFLCVVLACIVAFVGIVCVCVNNRNKTLLEAQTSSTAGENNISPNATTTTPPKQETTESTSSKVPESTEAETVAASVNKPGTIDNPTIITISETDWHLTLVNSGYRIPSDYEPDLVYVCGSSERLDKKVAEHYEKMYAAAEKDGIKLTPCSGYRSYELQERNYNRKIEFFEGQGFSTEEAKVKAATIIMPPGSSEHNLGYAMDIICVEEWFEGTEEFKWLQENAADYGFIMRYPKDKQDITKVIYEPWHWRYVGVETAKELKASGQVLEEYLGVS